RRTGSGRWRLSAPRRGGGRPPRPLLRTMPAATARVQGSGGISPAPGWPHGFPRRRPPAPFRPPVGIRRRGNAATPAAPPPPADTSSHRRGAVAPSFSSGRRRRRRKPCPGAESASIFLPFDLLLPLQRSDRARRQVAYPQPRALLLTIGPITSTPGSAAPAACATGRAGTARSATAPDTRRDRGWATAHAGPPTRSSDTTSSRSRPAPHCRQGPRFPAPSAPVHAAALVRHAPLFAFWPLPPPPPQPCRRTISASFACPARRGARSATPAWH